MRYVVSDIHGNYDLLIKYLKKVNRVGDKINDYYKIDLDTSNYLTGVLGGICIETLSIDYVE